MLSLPPSLLKEETLEFSQNISLITLHTRDNFEYICIMFLNVPIPHITAAFQHAHWSKSWIC